MMPIAGRLPFEWIYPTGEKQEVRDPKWEQYYEWGTVIAGDCHYVKRHMPTKLEGKIIATNTTTASDVELFRTMGVKYLVTTSPVMDGRSFGANMLEAALVAIAGKGRALENEELKELLDQLGFEPQLQELTSMDAIVMAGGIPKPEDPLYEFTQGEPKALLDVAGKPMVQWVLDAISGTESVERVVLISLPEEAGLTCSKPVTYLPDQGGLLENVRGGIEKAVEINPEATHVLTVSSDIPMIKSEMIDWMVKENSGSDLELYYTVILREVMEKRFPDQNGRIHS